MSPSQKRLQTALQYALAQRPKVGGFPFLAECLKQAGVLKNKWALPSTQSIYLMLDGVVVQQGNPLIQGWAEIPSFNEEALIHTLQKDQAGKSTFPEFLHAAWQAGVIEYEVDFVNRTVTYYGVGGESYTEAYPAVEVQDLQF